ncbi:FAD-dependent oxidoreductase, partial [Halorubrum sp. Atlit-26R]|uniref:FAD-dependent oxidoreductase n=1 Tax=Halorubrum sp. Atlit-26R TaxID=2282128 RepID=UPI0018F37C71
MGQLLAVELHHAGHEISVFDQHDKKDFLNCSMAAAGLLAPITELDKGEYLISQLGMEAVRDYWPAILSKLDEDIYYQYTGSILLSHPHDRADLQDAVERIHFKCNNAGLTHPVTVRLNQAELVQLEPELA